MLDLHRTTGPTPRVLPDALLASPSNRDQLALIRQLLTELQGEVSAISSHVDSGNARTCLRRAEEMMRTAAVFLSQAQVHGVDPVIEAAPAPSTYRERTLADPDAVLAAIPAEVLSVSCSAMLLRFGLQDTGFDRSVLDGAMHGRGWRYVPSRFDMPTGWWVRVRREGAKS